MIDLDGRVSGWNLGAQRIKGYSADEIIGERFPGSTPTRIAKTASRRRLSRPPPGEGMDEATLARAVEPFFTTKEVGKGTGLGLSMVHEMAEQSGGRLILKSRKGAGATAELWLPVASQATDAERHQLAKHGSKTDGRRVVTTRCG
jgi:hypothetical protein